MPTPIGKKTFRKVVRMNKQGFITIPAEVRKRHNMQPGDHFQWVETEYGFQIIHLPKNSIEPTSKSE